MQCECGARSYREHLRRNTPAHTYSGPGEARLRGYCSPCRERMRGGHQPIHSNETDCTRQDLHDSYEAEDRAVLRQRGA